jgi:hypothetical protein
LQLLEGNQVDDRTRIVVGVVRIWIEDVVVSYEPVPSSTSEENVKERNLGVLGIWKFIYLVWHALLLQEPNEKGHPGRQTVDIFVVGTSVLNRTKIINLVINHGQCFFFARGEYVTNIV